MPWFARVRRSSLPVVDTEILALQELSFFVYKASVHARKFTLRWGEGNSFIFKLKVIYFTFYVSYSCVSVSFSLKKEIHGEVSSSNIY